MKSLIEEYATISAAIFFLAGSICSLGEAIVDGRPLWASITTVMVVFWVLIIILLIADRAGWLT